MPIDGLFLNKLSKELNILISGKISKVCEISNNDYMLIIRSNYTNYNLLISLSTDYSRCHITNHEYNYPTNPKSFTMLLRKHLEGNIINNIYTHHNDRIMIFDVSGNNEIGIKENKKVIIELMGRYSNLILTKNDIIIDSLKHFGVMEFDRTILPNALYEFPNELTKQDPSSLSLEELDNIITSNNISSPKEIMDNFKGISPFACRLIGEHNIANNLYNLIHQDVKPVKFFNGKKEDLYFSLNDEFTPIKEYSSLSDLLDDFFYSYSNKETIKQRSNNLNSFISKELKKLNNKLLKLNRDLNDASNSDIYRLYGELLIANAYIKEKSNEIKVINYYDNKEIIIPLDIRYNIIDNSKIYFKKYQKSKNSIIYINKEIIKCQDEIEYFKLLDAQVKISNVNDILEIEEELINNKYINKAIKKKKKTIPHLLTYELNDQTRIMVGKNNIQNDLLTNKLSLPNEMWFHVKDAPGSHVVVKKTTELTENDIRSAAMIASYYSTMQDSSSVPVNYTLIKNIKKIPGKKNCFVSIKNEKTIYIDPSIDFINSLKVIK